MSTMSATSATLARMICNNLKEDIISLNYEIDTIFTEQRVADKYNSSKSTAREALIQLYGEGFLTKLPQRGYLIKNVNEKEYAELQQVRIMLEQQVVALIIREASGSEITDLNMVIGSHTTQRNYFIENRKFHLAMALLARNNHLYRIMENVLSLISLRFFNLGSISYSHTNERMQLFNYHKALVEALAERDLNKALQSLEADLKIFM